jgi:hypothetical protein
MRRPQRVGLGIGIVAAVLLVPLASAACGGKPHGAESHGSAETTAPPPPTPDTTPIEALRTPAGLVLKIDAATPTAPPPTPSPSPSPSSSS